MAEKFIINPFTGKFDATNILEEAIAHADLSDMPDTLGTNSDHDARYLKLDQTTPQTISNGEPIFSIGLIARKISSTTLFSDDLDLQSNAGVYVNAPLLYGKTNCDLGAVAYPFRSLYLYKLGLLTSNGFIKTSGSDGTLSIDTNTYLTSLSHSSLSDMPDTGGTNSDHDARYWTLATDQTLLTGDKSGSFDLTTTGNLDAGSITTPYTNTFVISPAGGDYTTIQAALTANATANTLFMVYPGTYTDDTIAFTANNQTIRGMGTAPAEVLVTSANANICNYGAFTGCRVNRIKMSVTAATSLVHTVQGAGGSCNFLRCHIAMTTNYATAGQQPCCFYSSGNGTVTITEGTIEYTHSGNNAGIIKSAIGWGANTPTYSKDLVNIDISGSNASTGIAIGYGTGAAIISMNDCRADITDATAAVIAGVYIGDAGTREYYRNNIHVNGGGALATGLYIAGAADIRSMYNHIHVKSSTNNYSFWTNAACTLVSQFDDITAVDGIVNTGGATISYVNSPSNGALSATGTGTFDHIIETTPTLLKLDQTTPQTVTASPVLNWMTASELLATDASKKLVSLAIATYPSLTEISYVKGVSSAIQTQLNGKAATLSGTQNTIAYFNTTSTIASLAVATYPSLTELSYVKGVTSAIQTQLGNKEGTIAAGTTAQYWRGDKTWQTLLGETSTTAYCGDRGKTAYDHSQNVTGAVHGATASNTVNMIVRRDSNGDFTGRYLLSTYVNMSHSAAARTSDTIFYSSTDNYIRKNTVSGFKTSLRVMSGFINFSPQSAKLEHLAAPARIEMGYKRAYLLFDPDTIWYADFQFMMPASYVSTHTLTVKIMWTSTVASNNVVWNAALMAMTSGDAALLETDSFDTANSTTTAASGTAGRPVTTSITMTNKDNVAAGDICTLRLYRNATSASDTNTGTARVAGIILEWN